MELNGANKQAEPDWVIVRDGGLWLVGQLGQQHQAIYLAPVFELHCQVTPHGQGVQVRHLVQPLMLIPALDRWPLSESANTWPLKGSGVERQVLDGIEKAELMAKQMRAAAAGLTLATEMPKIRKVTQ